MCQILTVSLGSAETAASYRALQIEKMHGAGDFQSNLVYQAWAWVVTVYHQTGKPSFIAWVPPVENEEHHEQSSVSVTRA